MAIGLYKLLGRSEMNEEVQNNLLNQNKTDEDFDRKWQKFKGEWEKEVEEIKKGSFDRKQCVSITNKFEIKLTALLLEKPDYEPIELSELQNLKTELSLALQMVLEKYRRENKDFWSKIFESLAEIFKSLASIVKSLLGK